MLAQSVSHMKTYWEFVSVLLKRDTKSKNILFIINVIEKVKGNLKKQANDT